MPRVAVYTCSIGGYDWVLKPRVKPDNADFLRFSDRRPIFARGWSHRSISYGVSGLSPRLISRFPKIRPCEVLSDYEIGVWIDSSVEVIGDITPLLREFEQSGSDVALFSHPSRRTVGQEIAYALSVGRIPSQFAERAEQQRKRYEAMGLLERNICECTILFYRLHSQPLKDASDRWWSELNTFTERDQISQPYAMEDPSLKTYVWDWHFGEDNPYFRRVAHRPEGFVKRVRMGAHLFGDSRLDYRVARAFIKAAGAVRRFGKSLGPTNK